MWYCRKCGAENYENSNFCQKCGSSKNAEKNPFDAKIAIIASCAVVIVILVVWVIKLHSETVKPIETPAYTTITTSFVTPVPTVRPASTPVSTYKPISTPKPLEIYPFSGSLSNYTQIPFYFASATSELKEGDILFTATYAMDDSINRPWVEGVRGNGSGESLTLSFGRTESIDAISLHLGYALDSSYYYLNNRPKTIRFEFSDGSHADYLFGDVNQEQIIQLNKTVETSYIKMTILDVYSGECDDTCIYLVKAYRR